MANDESRNGALPADRAIRLASPDEAGALSALAKRSKAYWGYSTAFMQACEAELTYSPEDVAANPFYLLHEGARLLGFYALGEDADGAVELEALFVEPAAIGNGCGRALIEHAKRTAAALGFRTMIVQGDPNAARFYAAAGGIESGTRESDSVPGRFLPLYRIALDAT